MLRHAHFSHLSLNESRTVSPRLGGWRNKAPAYFHHIFGLEQFPSYPNWILVGPAQVLPSLLKILLKILLNITLGARSGADEKFARRGKSRCSSCASLHDFQLTVSKPVGLCVQKFPSKNSYDTEKNSGNLAGPGLWSRLEAWGIEEARYPTGWLF